jgi:uncharacterized membrane protein
MNRLARIYHKNQPLNEPVWHIQIALFSIIVLQLLQDKDFVFGPKYIISAFELLLLVLLIIITQTNAKMLVKRSIATTFVVLITASNIISLGLVTYSLFDSTGVQGHTLLLSAVVIFITNIIIFGIWYWEIDYNKYYRPVNLIFPQTNAPEHAGLHDKGWYPTFFDYLYVSITNATAFSPTDSLPLTHKMKALMAVQSLVSLAVVVLVTAKAVSIIG